MDAEFIANEHTNSRLY